MKKKKTIVKKKESKKRRSDYWGTCFVSIWRAFFISEFLFLFRPHFSSLWASEKGRSKFLQNLRLFIIKLSLIQIFFFRFIHSFTIHKTMGANSLADPTHDLNEQISQLMQCKPLSEQQVSFFFSHFLRSTSFINNYASSITPDFF
jgi:hypothetical protein